MDPDEFIRQCVASVAENTLLDSNAIAAELLRWTHTVLSPIEEARDNSYESLRQCFADNCSEISADEIARSFLNESVPERAEGDGTEGARRGAKNHRIDNSDEISRQVALITHNQLGLSWHGKKTSERAIELRLRQMNFASDLVFVPTASDMAGSSSSSSSSSSSISAIQTLESRAAAEVRNPSAVTTHDSENKSLNRLTCRLQGGLVEKNTKRICAQLGLSWQGKKTSERAIELRLRQMNFASDLVFVPTASDM
eukprot:CAMPEP_0171989806 /NCGR_PEP_ID=MMETSP0993-20121228/276499_1 /TAXON_ID=483369 /ORGANISM="non described non described, Strain CCMP2098" /LENGTH=254 /DNA_ID=CAMNT_0012642803 /DNA_START=107 /DNA_END=870 /DNA_ORIENTATION=+